MLFAAPFRVPLAAAAAVSALLLVPHDGSAQTAASPVRHHDSNVNGIVAGAALGTIGGILAASVVDGRCGHELCNNPTIQTYALGVGIGAGAGIGLGWLIDSLHDPKAPAVAQARVDDPVGNGIAWGALAGAGVAAGLVGIAYAQCNDTCDAPARLPMYAGGMAIGAGSGAGVGWLIDKLHKGKAPAPVAVAIRADRQERAVRVSWQF
jgi:hypothetical protein